MKILNTSNNYQFHLKEGKTDILHRYKGENAFVAECKFWNGITKLYESIDQLFNRYLTWRDNKAAIILFVRTQDMTKILNKVSNEIHKHKYYLKECEHKDETWFNYIFRSSEDELREVKTAIMLFHLP